MTEPVQEINNPGVLSEVREAFYAYENALCQNDVERLTELFWGSPLTLRYGPQESLYGAAAIRTFRLARPCRPRPRVLKQVVISAFGQNLATANAEFQMPQDVRIGRQSQTWVRMLEGWRIVAAHVSYKEADRS